MSTEEYAADGADAVHKFARALERDIQPAQRIQASLGARDGMATLCAVEAVICDLWPSTTAKELVWLTRRDADGDARLQLRAFDSHGELLRSATFRLDERLG